MKKRRGPERLFGAPLLLKKGDLKPSGTPARLKRAGIVAATAAAVYLCGRLWGLQEPKPTEAAPQEPPAAPVIHFHIDAQLPIAPRPKTSSLELLADANPQQKPGPFSKPVDASPPAGSESLEKKLPEPAVQTAVAPLPALKKPQLKVKKIRVGLDFEGAKSGFGEALRPAAPSIDTEARR